MQKLIITLGLLVCLCMAAPKWNQLKGYTFEQYIRDFNKNYSLNSAEYKMRKTIFENKLRGILEFNERSSSTYRKGVNSFTDKSEDELSKLSFGYQSSSSRSSTQSGYSAQSSRLLAQSNVTQEELNDLPKEVDWRKQGVVSPTKDQGHCGSCWSFAAVSTIESHAAIKSGQLKTLSTQQLVSCMQNSYKCGGTGGCHGATAELAFGYVQLFGLTSEFKYSYSSYQGKQSECTFDPKTQSVEVEIDGYIKLPSNSYADLMKAIATVGPIAISVDASKWHDYESGVFSACDFSEHVSINHAVVLVGYGTDEVEGDYWIVRNSWGTKYGENGYIRVKRESETKCGTDYTPLKGVACQGFETPQRVCGQCGILYDSSYPLGVRVVG